MRNNQDVIPKCLADDVPIDLVLIKSFVVPPSEQSESISDSLAIGEVGFSKNGQLLACSYGLPGFNAAKIVLWDLASGKCVRRIDPLSDWTGVVLKPDGPIEFPYYFTTSPHVRLCYRTATGLEVQDDLASTTKRPMPLKQLDATAELEPRGLFFSSDDKCLAAICKSDASINVWDTQTGERLRHFALPDITTATVRSLAFDSTNRHLAAGIDSYESPSVFGSVIIWDMQSGAEVLHVKQEYRVFEVAFSANGDLLSGEWHGGRELGPGRVVVRSAGEFDDARVFHAPHGIWSIAILPQGCLVTGDVAGQLLLWDIESGKLLAVAKTHGRHVNSLAVDSSTKHFASGDWDSVARLWKVTELQKSK